MTDVMETRQLPPVSLTQKEKWRERFWFGLMGVLTFALIIAIVVATSFYQQVANPGIYRSDDELINGGKRFIDYFYSINAATVARDQLRAVNMMVREKDKTARIQQLRITDFIREAKDSRRHTEIDWSQTREKIINRGKSWIDVEYTAYLFRSGQSIGMLDIVIRLVPLEKTDTNTDGVGVFQWEDVAENPFGVKDET